MLTRQDEKERLRDLVAARRMREHGKARGTGYRFEQRIDNANTLKLNCRAWIFASR